MPKLNRTLQYMASSNVEATAPEFSLDDRLRGRPILPRLSYGFSDQPQVIRESEFSERLRSRPEGTQFVLDTGFIPRFEVGQDVWDAVLSHRLVITPGVWAELRPWLDNPYTNRAFRNTLLAAKDEGHPNIVFLDRLTEGSDLAKGARYYVRLLGLRKEAYSIAEHSFRHRHGRDPDESELDAAVQRMTERGIVLARKGRQDWSKPNFWVDEGLIVRAVLEGLESGSPIEILTRDTDLIEQFYKMIYLLDTHYRSMLFAKEYVRQPLNFPEDDPPDVPLLWQEIEREEARLIKKPAAGEQVVLPPESQPVHLACTCLGGLAPEYKCSSLSFLGEREMVEVVAVKGRTGGANTDLLDGRNLHICIHPHYQSELGSFALIGRDKFLEGTDPDLRIIDAELALLAKERRDRLAAPDLPASAATPEGSFGLALAAMKPPTRLGLHRSANWNEITPEELSIAITWSDPRTAFFADRSFLGVPVPENVVTAVRTRILLSSSAAVDGALACGSQEALVRCPEATGKRGWLRALPLPFDEPRYRTMFDHYVALLAHKRVFGRIVTEVLRQRLDRPPHEEEWRQEVLSYRFGKRRFLRAVAGLQNGPEVFEADLILVYAALTAVVEGRPVTVLTRDPATFEQFVSLTTSMAQEYRAWAVTERLWREGLIAPPRGDAFGMEKFGFRGAINKVVLNLDGQHSAAPGDLGDQLQRLESWLPEHALPVPFGCWLLEGEDSLRVYAGMFGLERPMQRLFDIKRETGGKNTDRLGDRDAHLRGTVQNGQGEVSLWVGENTPTRIGTKDFPGDDLTHIELGSIPTFRLIDIQNFADPFDFPWHAEL